MTWQSRRLQHIEAANDVAGSIAMTDLIPIPVVDIRNGGTIRHARVGEERARALRDACLNWFPPACRPILPFLDHYAKQWLVRSKSPYVDEIREIAAALGFPGI